MPKARVSQHPAFCKPCRLLAASASGWCELTLQTGGSAVSPLFSSEAAWKKRRDAISTFFSRIGKNGETPLSLCESDKAARRHFHFSFREGDFGNYAQARG
jgi:hypothetical protein